MRAAASVLLPAGAVLLYAGAVWTAPGASPVRWGRELVRPLALPLLWRGLDAAERAGTVGEAMAQARLLMQFLPGWADGHVHFAYRLALHGGLPAEQDPGARVAWGRLQAALAWLEEALLEVPAFEHELLAAMALLAELAPRHHPGLADRVREALGVPPAVLADRYLERAEAGQAPPSLREQRTFAAPRLVAAFLASGNREAALATVDWALSRLPAVRDPEVAGRWRTSLENLRAWLAGDRSIPKTVLEKDPLLEPVHPLLPD